MPSRSRGAFARRASGGFSLIELMVAVTISLVIMAALSWIFVGNSRTRAETERQNAQIENGSYALQVLNHDLQMAGYWAEYDIGLAVTAGLVTAPAVNAGPEGPLPDPCSLDPAEITLAMPLSVQGYYQSDVLDCIADVRADTDVLVVRRASGCVAGTVDCAPVAGDGRLYFQASACNSPTELDKEPPSTSNLFRLSAASADLTGANGFHKKDCVALADQHEFLTHIYFVANNDEAGDGIPTLKRAEIVSASGAAAWTTVSIAQGVERLHLEYGIDTDGDRVPNVFNADPINYDAAGCATPCIRNFMNTTAVNVYLLVRNPTETPGYTDTKDYTLGFLADGVTPNHIDALGDPYRRHAYTAAVRLNNPSIR